MDPRAHAVRPYHGEHVLSWSDVLAPFPDGAYEPSTTHP